MKSMTIRHEIEGAVIALVLTAATGCQETMERERVVESDSRALVVNEPDMLSGLPLEEVLQRMLDLGGDNQTTPMELLQMLFDSSNTEVAGVFPGPWHCDSPDNAAHVNGPAAFCPRAEGALAKSTGFFTPGDPDHFFPVAAVNRGDLFFYYTCGQYRIVYAKESGLTDPNNRVFLSFEVAVPNPDPGERTGCRPLAERWYELESSSPAEAAELLRSVFFDDLSGHGPILHPDNLGVGSSGDGDYYAETGQLGVSQHMEEHWEMREMVLATDANAVLRFQPSTLGNNPLPRLFEPPVPDLQQVDLIDFQRDLLDQIPSLGGDRVTTIGMNILPRYLSGESALGGAQMNEYVARAAGNTLLHDAIEAELEHWYLAKDCPPDDPLTSDSIVRRATVMSCAGCHAPALFLGEERKVGCGVTWPDSLGEVHIDERGNLSPALRAFLPERAEMMTRLLQPLDGG